MSLAPQNLLKFILAEYEGLSVVPSWGETSLFYNPQDQLPRGTYFCTIKEKDGENDKGSALDRDNVYRFNFGLPPKVFIQKFGPKPNRPAKGGIIEGPWDFTALDRLIPHPVYGWMGWVAILNPTQTSFEDLKPLLALSYNKARKAFERRL